MTGTDTAASAGREREGSSEWHRTRTICGRTRPMGRDALRRVVLSVVGIAAVLLVVLGGARFLMADEKCACPSAGLRPGDDNDDSRRCIVELDRVCRHDGIEGRVLDRHDGDVERGHDCRHRVAAASPPTTAARPRATTPARPTSPPPPRAPAAAAAGPAPTTAKPATATTTKPTATAPPTTASSPTTTTRRRRRPSGSRCRRSCSRPRQRDHHHDATDHHRSDADHDRAGHDDDGADDDRVTLRPPRLRRPCPRHDFRR